MQPTEARQLIHLEGLSKVFYTEDMETHALVNVHLDVRQGEYISISGPSGCGKSTLLAILGLLDSPSSGDYTAERQAGVEPEAERAGAHSQSRDRFHFPGVQFDRRPDGV
jgi:putative ABC transport system ATP-binding protein